jgi:hypothetical protein
MTQRQIKFLYLCVIVAAAIYVVYRIAPGIGL